MKLSTSDWHRRFLKQAQWTADLRDYVYRRIQFSPKCRALDVGCGTGALFSELTNRSAGNIFGIDLSFENLKFAQDHHPDISLALGNGLQLPFSKNSFYLTLCHFLLLWVESPLECLQEMCRVTKSGGWVLALAEPDYGGRIDYPASLSRIGHWQREALKLQHADPNMGRQLLNLFNQVGFGQIQCGALGGQWDTGFNQAEWQSEWDVIDNDLGYLVKRPALQDINLLRELDFESGKAGKRLLYVPTFYAIGQVP